MIRVNMISTLVMLPMAFAAGVAAISTAVNAGADASSPVRCEINAKRSGNSTTLDGVVTAKRGIKGSYRLSITKSGGGGQSDIDQSGLFSAAPGAAATVGTVTLGGPGSFVAILTITGDGKTTDCSRQIGGAL